MARRPDVLQTHTSKAGATGRIAALPAGRARPRAVVHTYHGHVLRGYFDHRRERVFRLIERLLARSADALVAVSEEVRNDLVRFGVAPEERFVVIPYGFELPAWSDADGEARERIRADLGAGNDVFLVGWAGRFTAIKRPLDLITNAARARRRGRRRAARPRRGRRRAAARRRRSRASCTCRTAATSSASSRASAAGTPRSTRCC